MSQKKSAVLLFILMLVTLMVGFIAADDELTDEGKLITKTYRLRYVTSAKVIRVLGRYIIDSSSPDVVNVITVTIMKKDEKEFEYLLNQLDTKKNREDRSILGKILALPRKLLGTEREPVVRPYEDYSILFHVYTVVASREGKFEPIANEELNRVLMEMSNVLNFRSYRLDGSSAITVKNFSEKNFLRLSSGIPNLAMILNNVSINAEIGDRPVIEIGQLELVDGNATLISTQTSLKANGYLVVGITKIGSSDNSLALILYAEIR